MKNVSRHLPVVAAGVLTLVVGVAVGLVGLHRSDPHTASPTSTMDRRAVEDAGVAAADEPGSVVEDFTHPYAEQILAEHGLKVFKGDGHIIFVTSKTVEEDQCPIGQIQVERHLDAYPHGVFYCFRTVGTKGFLTLEVPGTFGVRGGDKPIVATAELPEGEQEFPVPANGFVAIKPGSGNEVPQAILVELRLDA